MSAHVEFPAVLGAFVLIFALGVCVSRASEPATQPAVEDSNPADELRAVVAKTAAAGGYSWTTRHTGSYLPGLLSGETDARGVVWLSGEREAPFQIFIRGKSIAVSWFGQWHSAAEALVEGGETAGLTPERWAVYFARGYTTPLQRAAQCINELENARKTADGYSAELTREAAKQLLANSLNRPTAAAEVSGQGAHPLVEVQEAKASLRMTVEHELVSEIQVDVHGIVTFDGNERDVDQTSVTQIENAGSTRVSVPGIVEGKLGP